MSVKDGGPAYAHGGHASSSNGPARAPQQGMSLRDYFAGQALIGILSSRIGFLIDAGTENAPGWAYQVADAMIVEREKEAG